MKFVKNIFPAKKILGRHQKTVHKIYAPSNSFQFHDCGYEAKTLREMTGHMTFQHAKTSPQYCLYCNKIFSRYIDYMENMSGVHSLPTSNVDADKLHENELLPIEKAFGNSMKEYQVKVGGREIDLLHAMQVKREEINNKTFFL